jgi:hypothetical protein
MLMEHIYEEQLILTERRAQRILGTLVTAAGRAFRLDNSEIGEYIGGSVESAEDLARDVDRLCDYIRKLEGRC